MLKAVAIATLQAADVVTTWLSIHLGRGFEGNPVVAAILASPLGWAKWIGIKVVLVVSILALGSLLPRYERYAVGVFLAVVPLAVVINNLWILKP